MIFTALLILFVSFFIFINYLMANFGLFALLAKEYKTDLIVGPTHLKERISISLSQSLDSTKEFRHWLVVKVNNEGVYIGQTNLLNFFPLKMFIPAKKLVLLQEKNTFFLSSYVYQLKVHDNEIYLYSSKSLVHP